MTNKHCDDCGDPLFRYEGQEFCPTCSQAGEGEAQTQGQQAGAEGDAGARADASGQSAGIDRVDTGSGSAGAAETAEPPSPDAGEGGEAAATGATGQQPTRPRQPAPQARDGDVGGNVADARAALSRKLATLARQAEATDDVGRSRDLLAAAREAAEALAAIDAVGR